jgi:hypothetical protein
MGFPLKKTVSAGTILKIGNIPAGGNTPTQYTITVGTQIAANAVTASLTANASVTLQHEDVLTFGGTKITINIPDGSGLTDSITIGTTATSVPIKAAPAQVAANATALIYELRQVLGITDAAPSLQPQTVDTTDMKSGFGQSNVVVGVNRTIQCSGFRVEGDRAMYEVVMPYLTNDLTIRELLWAELTLPNGDFHAGPCRITDGGAQNQVRNPLQYNFTLTFEGNAYTYVAGDAALFA